MDGLGWVEWITRNLQTYIFTFRNGDEIMHLFVFIYCYTIYFDIYFAYILLNTYNLLHGFEFVAHLFLLLSLTQHELFNAPEIQQKFVYLHLYLHLHLHLHIYLYLNFCWCFFIVTQLELCYVGVI